MTKAEKMFKELGYEKGYLLDNIVYETEDMQNMIGFYASDKTFYAQWQIEPKSITIEELKAINQQVKELGWLDER